MTTIYDSGISGIGTLPVLASQAQEMIKMQDNTAGGMLNS
jgi:hypothetical protein